MSNYVVSISREFGSGGRLIGKKLAASLGIPCYDRTLIQKTAEKSGLSPDFIARAEERAAKRHEETYAAAAQFEKRTDHSIADGAGLRAALDRVRSDGYAVTDQFFETGVCSIAVPVPAPEGGALYAVSVSGPSQRIREKQSAIVAQLQSLCQRLAEKLA